MDFFLTIAVIIYREAVIKVVTDSLLKVVEMFSKSMMEEEKIVPVVLSKTKAVNSVINIITAQSNIREKKYLKNVFIKIIC